MEPETKCLTVSPPTTMQVVQVIQALAPVVAAARMFGVTQEQAAVVMLKGHELGIGLAAAFEFIHVIDGKPSLSPKGMLAMIYRSKDVSVELKRLTDPKGIFTGYQCTMRRQSTGMSHTVTWTLDDAKRAGLIKPKGNWESYPENMCLWRAVGYAADVVCPDLSGGMIRPEELGAIVDDAGDPVIEGEATPVPTSPVIATTPVETPLTLQMLVSKFGAEAVMTANDGRIPANDAELATIATKLMEAANAAA